MFTYTLQTVVEQAIALLAKLLESQGQGIAPAVLQFPEHLRFGAPTPAACTLAAGGVRHRRAFVALGNTEALRNAPWDRATVSAIAQQLLHKDAKGWRAQLGDLVFDNTARDLAAATQHGA